MDSKLEVLIKSPPTRLIELTDSNHSRYNVNGDKVLRELKLNKESNGILYCFWWMGEPDVLTSDENNLRLDLQGKRIKYSSQKLNQRKNHEVHHIQWSTEWFRKELRFKPLYVGKTSVEFNVRLSQHLKLHTNFGRKKGYVLNKKTTSCQFRSGFEYLFNYNNNIEFMLNNVGVTVKEEKRAEDRFYLENLAIGCLRPWFNIDCER